jgi:uncharacterized protein (DUF302 family)
MENEHRPSERPEGATEDVGEGIVTKLSPWSVAETLGRLSAILSQKGMKTFAVIDHSGEAAQIGLELRDTKVVIFGNPHAGTALMEASPLAALDLPLKVLVWEDGQATRLSYLSPAAFGARYELSDDLVESIAGIDVLTDAVVEQ